MDNYNYYYNSNIGDLNGNSDATDKKEHVIVQSLWTKPITDGWRFGKIIYMCALSLEYAHRSGYKVHMHTDTKGYMLLRRFGYDRIYRTLDKIPDNTPKDLFAVGKFYAMKAEGIVGKIHTDVDVFIRKPHMLDKFYDDKTIDVVCQQEEDMNFIKHDDKICHMHILGYPTTTRPDWNGSFNTGVVGFNNKELAKKYFKNYFDALEMYSGKEFKEYKEKNKDANLLFDFVLEQITLSYMSVGHNVLALLPSNYEYARGVANAIGYLHLQGMRKWNEEVDTWLKETLKKFNPTLYEKAKESAEKAQYSA